MNFSVNDKKGQKDNSSVLCIIVKNLVNVTVVPRQELSERDCRLLKILAITLESIYIIIFTYFLHFSLALRL